MGYCLLQKNETFNDTIRIWSQKTQGQKSGSYWSFEDILITNTEEVIFYINDNRLNPVASSNIWWVRADGIGVLWSESVPDPCSKITIRIDEDVLLQYATENFNLTVTFTAPGWMPDISFEENQEIFDNFLKDRGFKLKTQLTTSPKIFCDGGLGKNWLFLAEDVDLIVSNGLPLNQTDNVGIYTKNESNYSLFQHSKTLIEEYYYIRLQSLNDIKEDTLIPMLNNQNEWVIHLYADVLYNMSDIEFVFETPFESDRDIQFFLERAYDQTKVTNDIRVVSQWFDVKSGVENINYRVASQAQGKALAIEPRIPVDRFEINLMGYPVRIENEDKDKHIYAYEIIDEVTTVWEISSENESLYNNIIYIQHGLFGTEDLYLWDNRSGQLITQTSKIKGQLVFALDKVECGYCRVDELATMLGFTNIQIQDDKENYHALDKGYYVEIYKTTSGKYTILPCYSDINPGNKLLLPQGYHFILYNIDEVTINMSYSNLSNLAPNPFKKIYNIETPLKLLLSYCYFETAFYNHKRQLSYDNILIKEKKDFFTVLKNHGAQIKNENKWQYDNNNQRWYGYEPLFVKWKDYEAFKIKDSTTQDFYSYKNMNNFLMIPHTTNAIVDSTTIYYIDPKEIALCRYDINSYLFNDSNIKNQIKRSSFLYLLDSNKIEVGQLSKETDKQYSDLEKDKIYYDSTGKQSVNINNFIDSGYNYIKIPRYKIAEGSQEKYFKLLSIPNNRCSTSQSYEYDIDEGWKELNIDYNQYYFNLNEQDSGLNYSETDKQINAQYWTASPQIYPEVIFNNTVSLEEGDKHTLFITSNKIQIDNEVHNIYPNDVVVCYKRKSQPVNIKSNFTSFEGALWHLTTSLSMFSAVGKFMVTEDSNKGSLKTLFDIFRFDQNNALYDFKGAPIFKTKNIASSLFTSIIKQYTKTESILIEGGSVDGNFNFVSTGNEVQEVFSGICLGNYKTVGMGNVESSSPAKFTLDITTTIDFIPKTLEDYFNFQVTEVSAYTEQQQENSGWVGCAKLTGKITPSWTGVLHDAISFYGTDCVCYEDDQKTSLIQISKPNANEISKYINYNKKALFQAEGSAELTVGLYGPNEQSSCCAIVIWRNGKLDLINPETPEGLFLQKSNEYKYECYVVQDYFGLNENVIIPKIYNNFQIMSVNKINHPYIKTLTCESYIIIQQGALMGNQSLQKIELYNQPIGGMMPIFGAPYSPEDIEDTLIPEGWTKDELIQAMYPETLKTVIFHKTENGIVPDYCFYNASNIKNISLLDPNISIIGEMAFYNCGVENLTMTSLSSLTRIEPYAFYNCPIKELNLSTTVLEYIGEYAFYGCGLSKIDLSNSTKLEEIQSYCFSNTNNLTSINLPSSILSINDLSFSFSALKSIDLSQLKDLQSIKNGAFGASMLTEVKLPDNGALTEIGDVVFTKSLYLEEIAIPSTVEKIGNGVFSDCEALKKIWIPKSVESMGYHCFYNCNENLIIYCEAKEQPTGWHQEWNSGNHTIKWNSSFEDYQSA